MYYTFATQCEGDFNPSFLDVSPLEAQAPINYQNPIALEPIELLWNNSVNYDLEYDFLQARNVWPAGIYDRALLKYRSYHVSSAYLWIKKKIFCKYLYY